MLSTGAFNALLKTLEEPPSHAIFILATTELNKVPATIISRCQTLEFNKISRNYMNDKLKEIAENENIIIEDSAIDEISRCSNGGLRDAIGLLEKANSYSDDKITLDIIKEISGNITEEELADFIKCFEEKNIKEIIEKIDNYYDEGIDLIKLINSLIEYLSEKIISEEKYEKSKCDMVQEFDSIINNLRKTENPKILLEIILLNMLVKDEKNTENKTIIKETEELKEIVKKEEIKENNIIKNDNSDLKKIRVGNTLASAQKQIISNIRNNWDKIKDLAFDKSFGNIARLLSTDITPVAAGEKYVIIVSKLTGLSEQINNDLYTVENIFEKIFNQKYKVICISEKEWNEYIALYKKDKTFFKYVEENTNNVEVKNMTLKEKAKALFEDL